MTINKAVAVVIEDNNGNILLTQRGKTSRDEFGKWENCGGAIDQGETEEEAIKREVKEELGCELNIKGIIYKDHFTTDSGATWQVTVFKGVLLGNPEPQNTDENADVKWFSKQKLNEVDLATYTRQDYIKFGWIKE